MSDHEHGGGGVTVVCSGEWRSEVGERGSVTYLYVYEDVDVCDGEAFDGGDGGELGISGISEMVESSSKRLCSATGVPSAESVIHIDKSDKNTVLG